MKPLFDLKGLVKKYEMGGQPFYAVNHVSLTIGAGEYVAIMGPSGSGKSTLMHLLGLLDAPTDGDIVIQGMSTRSLDEVELARLRNEQIGFVFQDFHLLPRTSIVENILLPYMYARNKVATRSMAITALERVGLDARQADKVPNQLSGGQQQRVAIARALITNPTIILADEPTGNLDSRSTEEILGLFQDLNDVGVTLVLVTHDAYVAQHAKRILHFGDGVVQFEEQMEHPVRTSESLEVTT